MVCGQAAGYEAGHAGRVRPFQCHSGQSPIFCVVASARSGFPPAFSFFLGLSWLAGLRPLWGDAESRLRAGPCGQACHACWLGIMVAAWLGGGGSPPVRGPKGRSTRADIPDLVATEAMAILYACRSGSSMARLH